jgi:hypothetical protein
MIRPGSRGQIRPLKYWRSYRDLGLFRRILAGNFQELWAEVETQVASTEAPLRQAAPEFSVAASQVEDGGVAWNAGENALNTGLQALAGGRERGGILLVKASVDFA